MGIHFSNQKLSKKILEWLEILPANFIIFGTDIQQLDAKNIVFETSYADVEHLWLDALLCDCEDVVLERLMEAGVVPLVNDNNYLGKILYEFHPGRAEGNAYIYEKDSSWSAYYALIRYLENHKFPYDNRNLVKNVVWA